MRTAFALTAVFAWIMIQVPIVFCDSGCGAPVSSVFVMETHDCHDVQSTRHQMQCGHAGCQHDHGQPERDPQPSQPQPSQPQPDDDDGRHYVVHTQSHTSVTQVVLPPLVVTAAAVLDRAALLIATQTSGTAAWDELDPPADTDPVSAADRLQV